MSKMNVTAPKNYVSGKYAVGTTCFSVVDAGRKEVLGDKSGDRKIAVRMYYPVEKESVSGKERAEIFSQAKKNAILKAYRMKKLDETMCFAEYYKDVSIVQNQKFPLIMFSMGYNSYIESNTYLLCAIASHGYIVASVGHAYEAVENDYEDGSIDLFDKTINKMMYTNMFGALLSQKKIFKLKADYPEILKQFDIFQNKYTPYIKNRVIEWKKDIEKALETIKDRYADYIEFRCGIGASGHSLGGCLAYYLCRYHDEFSCGINIDGELFGEYPEKIMQKPFCQISCEENINVEIRPFLQTNADTYQVVFKDMKHMGFTDAKFYIPAIFSGKLDSEEMFRHLVYCHTVFFDKYLKGADIAFDGLPSDKIKYNKIQ